MLVAMESLVHNPEKLVEEILQMIKDKKSRVYSTHLRC
jgi:hypothetical protein